MGTNVIVNDKVMSLDNWGLNCQEVVFEDYKDKVFGCFVSVSNLREIAERLAESVIDLSWISNLDRGTKKAYERTASPDFSQGIKESG